MVKGGILIRAACGPCKRPLKTNLLTVFYKAFRTEKYTFLYVWYLVLIILSRNVYATSRFYFCLSELFLFNGKSYVRTIRLHKIDRRMKRKRNEDVCYLQNTEVADLRRQIEEFVCGFTRTNMRCREDKKIKGKGAAQISQN